MNTMIVVTFFAAFAVVYSLARGKQRYCSDVQYCNIYTTGPQLHLEMSKTAHHDDVLTCNCSSHDGPIPPHVRIAREDRSNCQLEIISKKPQASGGFCTQFVLKDITGNCSVQCFIGKSKIAKTISPIAEGTFRLQ